MIFDNAETKVHCVLENKKVPKDDCIRCPEFLKANWTGVFERCRLKKEMMETLIKLNSRVKIREPEQQKIL